MKCIENLSIYFLIALYLAAYPGFLFDSKLGKERRNEGKKQREMERGEKENRERKKNQKKKKKKKKKKGRRKERGKNFCPPPKS
jgi:hypothetical protein